MQQSQCPAPEVTTFRVWVWWSPSVPNPIKNLEILQSNTSEIAPGDAHNLLTQLKGQDWVPFYPPIRSWLTICTPGCHGPRHKCLPSTLPWATSWHRRARPTQGTAIVPDFLQTSKNNITTCPRLSRRSFRTKRLIFNKELPKYQLQSFKLETGQNHRFDAAATLLGASTKLPPVLEQTANLRATGGLWIGEKLENHFP